MIFFVSCDHVTCNCDRCNFFVIYDIISHSIIWVSNRIKTKSIIHNSDIIADSIMILYLDDILIFTQTLKEYYGVVCRVLEVLALASTSCLSIPKIQIW